ncbi:MAG: hypothetical protein OER77_00820 [Myxococcales bacterium]|nr:hypothetical protein [Myxococcales bacterium]
MASPLSVGAQAGQEDATPKSNLQEPALSSEPSDDEEGGLSRERSLPRAYTDPASEPSIALKEQEHGRHRMHPAGIAFLTTTGVTVVGAVLVGVGMTRPSTGDLNRDIAPVAAGAVLMMIGAVGMIISGAVWGKRTRQGRTLKEARYERPRRVQWDLAKSRVVF